jgi:hypothetical protein
LPCRSARPPFPASLSRFTAVAVRNVGAADAEAFFVELKTSEGSHRRDIAGLAAAGTRAVPLEIDFQDERCPLAYAITVDSGHGIDECNETNNSVEGKVCCE